MHYDKKKDREQMTKMIAVECLPFIFSSCTGFVRYIQTVYNPSFQGFSKTTVRSDFIKFKNEYRQYL